MSETQWNTYILHFLKSRVLYDSAGNTIEAIIHVFNCKNQFLKATNNVLVFT